MARLFGGNGRLGTLGRDTWLLMGARAARSLGQGALVVGFALYLDALGWTGTAIGGVLTAALIFGAAGTLAVGPLTDRIGRRGFLLAFETTQIAAAVAAYLTAEPWVLVTAAIVGGFGRGANGAAGPFAPAEQAWLAQGIAPEDRGSVYSLNAAVGFIGMGFGALLGVLPSVFQTWLPGPAAFRPLFLIVAAGSVLCMLLLWLARDRPDTVATPARADSEAEAATALDAAATLTRQENRMMLRLVIANAVNGVGIGLTGPLIAYWLSLRFGVGPTFIGPLMALGLFLGAAGSVGTGRLTRRIGLVRSVVFVRAAGIVMLVAMPFSPTFTVASVLYLLRSISNRGTIGAREALSVGLVRSGRIGLVSSLNNGSQQIPRAVGPGIAGAMFDAGFLIMPFLIGAGFQAAYLYLYDRGFRSSDPNLRPRPAPVTDGASGGR